MTAAAVIARAAELLAGRSRWRANTDRHWTAGGDTYVLLSDAARELYVAPAVEMVRRQVGAQQLQWWKEADVDAAVGVFRDVAGLVEPPDLHVASLRAELEGLRNGLAAALGHDHLPVDYATSHLVREVAQRLTGQARTPRAVEARLPGGTP